VAIIIDNRVRVDLHANIYWRVVIDLKVFLAQPVDQVRVAEPAGGNATALIPMIALRPELFGLGAFPKLAVLFRVAIRTR
jgi:hypothetical protein